MERWKDADRIQLELPITKERLDIVAYHYSYDTNVGFQVGDEFWDNTEVGNVFLNLIIQELDPLHIAGFFKKSDECRYYNTVRTNGEVRSEFDEGEEYKNVVDWYYLGRYTTGMMPYMVFSYHGTGEIIF